MSRWAKYRRKHPERIREARLNNYRKHRETVLARNRRWRTKHKEEIKKRRRAKYFENKEKIIEAGRKYYALNKEVVNKRCSLYYLTHKEKAKERARISRLGKKFGLTVEDYNSLLLSQNGSCAICHGCNTNSKRLAVDHCHTTGKVRGLLCDSCNLGLGMFKDRLNILSSAMDYINKFQSSL